jgi:4-hydroxybenzoyl-CoA thioesterase
MAVKIIGYTFDSVPYMISRKTIHIEWGDCDPAQIVYFPRYFEYFDSCTAALFAKAGFPKRKMLQTYGILGFPVVEVKGSFKAPSRFSEDVIVESKITEWGNSSFHVHHRLFKNGNVLAVECFETRVWAAQLASDPEKIESRPIPREVIAKFEARQTKKRRNKKAG